MLAKPLSLALGLLFNLNAFAVHPAEIKTANYFDTIKSNPKKLSHFLQLMPKGGDLHNHLSGAIYAESLLSYAKKDDFCIDKGNFTILTSLCPIEDALNSAVKEPHFQHKLIDSWSMRHFKSKNESGADHFFSTFLKFDAIVKKHYDQVLARVIKQAALDHVSYLELMITTDNNQSGALGKQLGWDNNFAHMREQLLAHDFNKIVQSSHNFLDALETNTDVLLKCKVDSTLPACQVKVGYLYQIFREQPPEMVFAQMLAAFEIASNDHRVVGLNMVQAEHGKRSLQDYSLQMQMMKFLHQQYPDVNISLHAGELNETVASAQDLSFHIDEAVNVAQAQRIGHGVDIAQEHNLYELLTTMAKKEILVEINLSSNALILGVKGQNHPLSLYYNAQVPVALSTDDQGINRSNLSKEYQIAVNDFGVDYTTLKFFARNSLQYAFLTGKQLWLDNNYQRITAACASDNPYQSGEPTTTCKEFLQANEKAAMQWRLEHDLAVFENNWAK